MTNKNKKQVKRSKFGFTINRKALLEGLDWGFNINWVSLFSNGVYGILYTILFTTALVILKNEVLNGAFQTLVGIFILILALERADIRLSNVPGIFLIMGFMWAFGFVFETIGFPTALRSLASDMLVPFLIITLIYQLFLRKELIKWAEKQPLK